MKIDHGLIFDIIPEGSKTLDLGTGEGELLELLITKKKVKAQGIEINEEYIYKCVEKGINVFHGDFESGLSGFPDNSFDFVILNHSMQEATKLEFIIEESRRVGRKVIISFPNFAYISARCLLFFMGKAPVTSALPYRWYDTPNRRFLSIKDFIDFCSIHSYKILKRSFYGKKRKVSFLPNLFAFGAIFVIEGMSPDNEAGT